MRNYILKFIFIIYSVSLLSLEILPGSGNNVYNENKSGNFQNLYYHTGSDDFYFYGTNKWAVNFKISDILENTVNDSFLVSGMRIYIQETTTSPQTINNVRVYLYDNLANQPGNILYHNTGNLATLTPGWNEIHFTSQHYIKNAWVVIDLPTNENGPYMSASMGNGRNSYYYDRFNNESGLFVNMQNMGFGANFLVDLTGTFSKPLIMLDIKDLYVSNNLRPESILKPEFNIKNNSAQIAENVFFTLRIQNNNAGINFIDSVFVSQSLNPGESISVKDLYEGISLPNITAQYSVTIETACTPGEYALFKRKKIHDIDIFDIEKEKSLVEIFADTREQQHIDLIQALHSFIENPAYDMLFHFPVSVDYLHTEGAYKRSLQYLHKGAQHCYFNGQNRISNFVLTEFLNNYNNNLLIAENERTFLNEESLNVSLQNNSLKVNLTVSNRSTYLLQSHNQNASHRRDLVFNAAFIQNKYFHSRPYPVLTQYINSSLQGDIITLPANTEETIEKTFPLYRLNLLPQNEYKDLKILVWIQDRFNKKIYFHKLIALDHIDFKDISNLPAENNSEFAFYPNPIKHNATLNIKHEGIEDFKNLNISLYNIKGQKVHTAKPVFDNDSKQNTLNLQNIDLANGIYFLKIDWTNSKNQNHSELKKLLVIK